MRKLGEELSPVGGPIGRKVKPAALRGRVASLPERADLVDETLQLVELALLDPVHEGGIHLGPSTADQEVAVARQAMPELLADKGHERVEQPEIGVEHLQTDASSGGVAVLEPALDRFQVPVAELVPAEL